MLTRVENGRAVDLRGDPAHPFTRGTLCAKVRDYIGRVYHPERILYPLKRTGSKGDGQFTRISWDEALDTISDRLENIISTHGSQAILPFSYLGQQGLLNGLHVGDPFFHVLGASVGERTFCNAGATLAHNMTLGPTPGLDPESFAHARFIIIWACNIVSTMPHHWPFILQAKRAGAKVVVIDPVRSKTAQHADWHVAIRPGTDVALALGLMHVLFAEGLLDDAYATQHIHGLDELKTRAAEYPVARVSEITGLAEDEIVTLAREYAGNQPSAIRVGVAIERNRNGAHAVQAMCVLPALVGAWRHAGGGLFQNAGRAFPMRRDALARPDLIRPGTRVVNLNSLGAALDGGLSLDPPIQALFVYNANPLTACPEQSRIDSALRREDLFTVVSEQFMTETAQLADVVLPATTQLEQFDLMYSWGHFHLALNQPAIAPLGEAVSNTELFRRLAKRMGFDDPCLSRSDIRIAHDSLDWSHASLAGITLERLQSEGYARLNVGDPSTRTPHADGTFPTPTGKVEALCTQAAHGSTVLTFFREGYEALQEGAPLDSLPSFTSNPASTDYPLGLFSAKTHYFLNSSYANFSQNMKRCGAQWVMIHPDDAAARNIENGKTVRVFNELASLRAEARVSHDVVKGSVLMPHGYWSEDNNVGINALNRDRPTPQGKAQALADTRVDVELMSM